MLMYTHAVEYILTLTLDTTAFVEPCPNIVNMLSCCTAVSTQSLLSYIYTDIVHSIRQHFSVIS